MAQMKKTASRHDETETSQTCSRRIDGSVPSSVSGDQKRSDQWRARPSSLWSVYSPAPSLHLLLHLVGLSVHLRHHLHGLAAAAADVPEEAEVGAARHDDHDDDDDDGGAEGGRHGVLQDRLEAPQADPTGPLDQQAVIRLTGGLTCSNGEVKGHDLNTH